MPFFPSGRVAMTLRQEPPGREAGTACSETDGVPGRGGVTGRCLSVPHAAGRPRNGHGSHAQPEAAVNPVRFVVAGTLRRPGAPDRAPACRRRAGSTVATCLAPLQGRAGPPFLKPKARNSDGRGRRQSSPIATVPVFMLTLTGSTYTGWMVAASGHCSWTRILSGSVGMSMKTG